MSQTLLLLFVLGTTAPVASAEGQKSERARFVVIGAVDMSHGELPSGVSASPITFDARFVIRVKVEEVLSGPCPWGPGSEQVFSHP